jgi:exosortase D (VPLPA-CTERM-specific)
VNQNLIVWSYANKVLVLLAVGFILLIPTFWGGLAYLVERWDLQEEYSHGYMIPLVTAYLIWQRKDLLKTLEFRPTWAPVGLVVLGLGVSVIGEISALYILIHLSLILIILSMAWATMGWHAFKYVMIPLALLAFAIPLPYFLEATLTADLQLISTKLGVAFIRLFGIPVYAEGNVIDLGGYQLQVVEACSGLRYLYPLMGVGFIVVYMYQVEMWKRALIFLSTIPITILMNSLRIGVIGILVEHWGQGMADGFLHYFEGWVIFIACLAILVGEMWLLNRFSNPRRSFAKVFTMPAGPDLAAADVEHKSRELPKPFIACVAMVMLCFVIIQAIDTRDESIPDRESFVTFPLYIDDWKGQQDTILPNISDKLQFTDYLLNNYQRADDPSINFYVAYYESQRKGISPHSPRVCVPGGGWSITDIKRETINLDDDRGQVNVNRAIIQNGLNKQLVYYWFKQRGRDIANEYWMKWYLLTDSISLNRTDGSLVRLTTPILPNEKERDAELRLNEFLSTVNPMLDKYIPSGSL